MSAVDTINVEVAYATPEEQIITAVNVDAGTTAEIAITKSGVLSRFAEIKIDDSTIGLFGKVIKKDTVLKEGDRVEIYRALIADPKEIRRQRAKEGKAMKKGSAKTADKKSDSNPATN